MQEKLKVVIRFPASQEVVTQFQWKIPHADFAVCPADRGLDEHLDARILIGGMAIPEIGLGAMPDLQWIQALSVGIDGYDLDALGRKNIVLTNTRGVNVINLAEHALALMLSFARGLPDLLTRQARREWTAPDRRPQIFELQGQKLLILGYGSFGRAVAVRAGAFGMEVSGVSRSGSGTVGEDGVPVFGVQETDRLLAEADHVLLALPMTGETHHFLDASRMSRIRPGSFLYNLGRGELVDHDALVSALSSGVLAGAGLDVTSPEPLPADSPLWKMPNVLMTSHTAGLTPRFLPRAVEFIAGNLERFARGRRLANIVDPVAGY